MGRGFKIFEGSLLSSCRPSGRRNFSILEANLILKDAVEEYGTQFTGVLTREGRLSPSGVGLISGPPW